MSDRAPRGEAMAGGTPNSQPPSTSTSTSTSTTLSLAKTKRTQCLTFLTFARHLRDQIIYHQRQQIQLNQQREQHQRERQQQLHQANTRSRPQALPARPPTPQIDNRGNDDIAALAQQWLQLRDGTLLDGTSGEVLKGSFGVAAEVELGRLDGLEESERVRGAREVWREVVKLAAGCRDVKGEVESALLGLEGSLGSWRDELGWA